MEEEWREIEGFGGKYQVSDQGNLRRRRKDGTWAVHKHHQLKGYCQTCLTDPNGRKHTVSVHRLVAMAFIPNPKDLPEVNHRNCNPADNRLWNLEWVTHSYNVHCGEGCGRKAGKKTGMKVRQLTADGKLITTWPSAHEAARSLGVSRQLIDRAARTGTKAIGCRWEREESERRLPEGCGIARPVQQVDQDGNVVASYPSLSDAARRTGHWLSHLSRASRHPSWTAYGFRWIVTEE